LTLSAMVCAALTVEFAFGATGLVPASRSAHVTEASVALNYTTVLNLIFLALAAWLVARFVRSGGVPMLRMMNRPMGGQSHAPG